MESIISNDELSEQHYFWWHWLLIGCFLPHFTGLKVHPTFRTSCFIFCFVPYWTAIKLFSRLLNVAQRNSNYSSSALPAKFKFQIRIVRLKSPLNPNYNINPITDLRFQMLKIELSLLVTGLCHCWVKLLIVSLWRPRVLATVSLWLSWSALRWYFLTNFWSWRTVPEWYVLWAFYIKAWRGGKREVTSQHLSRGI